MGLLDKFKNLFTEEVEEEVVEVKQEIAKPKEPIKIETPTPIVKKEEDPIKSENLSLKKDEKFVFPVYFDDKDFDDIAKKEEQKPKKIEQPVVKKEVRQESTYKEAYNNKKTEVKEEKKVFKPTPIISPVYGILDKNYYKEDIVVSPISRNTYHDSSKPITIDDVRKKAFGTLEDDLEKTLFSGEVVEDAPRHGKLEDDDSIFNEFDFANAVEEDKKRDLSKDGLKADIESLLDDKEFAKNFNFHSEKEESLDDSKLEDDILSEENESIGELEKNESMSKIKVEDNDEDFSDEIELPNNVSSSDDEIEKAYADSSDLNDSDLFNLIDSMYDKEEE